MDYRQTNLHVLDTKEHKEIGEVKLIANLYGILDSVDDIVELGASANSISGRLPKILDNHDHTSVTKTVSKCIYCYEVNRQELQRLAPATIQKFDAFGIKGKGCTGALIVETQHDLTDELSLASFRRLQKGWIDSASIGFRPIKAKRQFVTLNSGKQITARVISELDLFEVSYVLFPANSGSTVIDVRSAKLNKQKELEYLNGIIQDADRYFDSKALDELQRQNDMLFLEQIIRG